VQQYTLVALFASNSLGRVGHAVQPDVMRSVFAPLNNLFQESAALQRRRWHALFRDVIKNIGRFAFPDTSHTDMGESDGKAQICVRAMARLVHEEREHVEFGISQSFDVGCRRRKSGESFAPCGCALQVRNLWQTLHRANPSLASQFGARGKAVSSASRQSFHPRSACLLWERGRPRG
jgi:hypothetical protein